MMSETDKEITFASYLWHKIDPQDRGWVKQGVFPMWASEAISKVTGQALSEQNVNCHLHLLAIAQGNLTPTDEDTINDILAEDKSDFNHEEFIRQSEITIQNMINENHNKSI